MSGRAIRAGETIRLRAQFKDDLGDVAEAGSVFVHIYEPDEDITDLNNATVVSGIATYLGEGIFEYQYAVPSVGPDGIWYDTWEGILTGQALTSSFSFEVSASGLITAIDQQLHNNNLVEITLTSGIKATDGTYLSDGYTAEFLTTTAPSYTDTRKVRLTIGGFTGNLEDDTIQTAILEASLDADTMTFTTVRTNNKLFEHARREYTTCLASSILMDNLNNSLLRTKTLADLHVEYDTGGVNDMINKLQACIDKWAPQVMSGGGVGAVRAPSMVVKGALDPDRALVSRMWESTVDGAISRRIPAANTRERPLGKRRAKTTFKKWRW